MLKINEKAGVFIIKVKVAPNAGKSLLAGEHNGALKLKIGAPPDKNKANHEVISFLAEVLKTKKININILQGETSRDKVVSITGVKKETLQKLAE
ncbi:MAG: DUF167 domain-containing protein [bacterium]